MANGGPREPHLNEASPYVELDREAWAELGQNTDQPLSELEIERVRGLGDQLDLDEVQQVYLPLSRLLSLYVEAAGALHRAQEDFLDRPHPPRTPFVIGLAKWLCYLTCTYDNNRLGVRPCPRCCGWRIL